MGILKLELVGQEVEVEYRSALGLYFVVYPGLACPISQAVGFELVMAFEQRMAAGEIAINTRLGVPFFTMIPVVSYQTPYPRPWLSYPPADDYHLNLRIVGLTS